MSHEHIYAEPVQLVIDMTDGNIAQRLYAPRARRCTVPGCNDWLLEPAPYVEPVRVPWWRRLARRLLRRS